MSHKRSLNRYKSIYIFINKYQKHVLTVTDYLIITLSI